MPANPPPSLGANLTGTLSGPEVIGLMERLRLEQEAALQERSQLAAEQAQQAQAEMQQAVAQPPPQLQAGDTFIPSLLGDVASVLSGNQAYGERAQQGIQQNRAELMQKRRDNLSQLGEVYAKRADEAKKAGDLEQEEKLRGRRESISKQLDQINQNLDRQVRLTEAKERTQAAGAATEGIDPNEIAQAIMNGFAPPESTGLARGGVWAKVLSITSKSGFNMVQAKNDLVATRRHWTQLNSGQQQRLRQAAQTAYDSIDLIDQLSSELSSKVPRGRFPVLNKQAMRLAMGGAFGPEAQAAANNLNIQIIDLQSELAQVYRGGYAPTNEAMKQAEQQLKGEWSEATLKSAGELARKNLRIRLNSIAQTDPITPGFPGRGAAPEPAAETPAPPSTVRMLDKNGVPHAVPADKVATAEAQGWKKQ